VQVPDAEPDDTQLGPGETRGVPHCPMLDIEQLWPRLANGRQAGVAIVVSQNEVNMSHEKKPVPTHGPLDGSFTHTCEVGSQAREVNEPPHCALAVQDSPSAATARQVDDVPFSPGTHSRPSAQGKPLRAPAQGLPACAGAAQMPLDEQKSPAAQRPLVPHGCPSAPGAVGVEQPPKVPDEPSA